VIVLVDHEEEDTLFAAITSGAAAYLPQSVEVDDLRDALRRVAGGGGPHQRARAHAIGHGRARGRFRALAHDVTPEVEPLS